MILKTYWCFGLNKKIKTISNLIKSNYITNPFSFSLTNLGTNLSIVIEVICLSFFFSTLNG